MNIALDTRPAELGEEAPTLRFVRPIVGFDAAEYTLTVLDGGPLGRLVAADGSASFFVVPAGLFFADYAPSVEDDTVADLEIHSAEDALVLLVLCVASSLENSTANLRAPLVVNLRQGLAAQIILEDQELPLAAPLFG